MRSILRPSLLCVLVVALTPQVWAEDVPNVDARKEVLVQKLVAHGFAEEEVAAVFQDERVALHPNIIGRSGKGINYLHPKFRLLTKESVARGRRVIEENLDALRKIEALFGVEKEILVGVYRLETNLGRYLGDYHVFNSLLTFAVIENRRTAWAEKEWISLMILSRKNGIAPLSIKGSWAGAFGLCQFVPSSYLQYAADGDGDGFADLFNVKDALASIASYLKANGWDKTSREKKKKALRAYNHCDSYVKAVLGYADATRSLDPLLNVKMTGCLCLSSQLAHCTD
jgi:membrane-bound lytic murein transglycosylase B